MRVDAQLAARAIASRLTVTALAIRASALDAKTAGLRALRLAREEAVRQEEARRSAMAFWDNIDTSAGLDACHPWKGERKWNHTTGTDAGRYEHGAFRCDECKSWIAQRVLVFKTYGREVPADLDVSPICGDHLCVNIRHMAIVKHGGQKNDRANRAVPVEEYFRDR